jgi:plastocyanin
MRVHLAGLIMLLVFTIAAGAPLRPAARHAIDISNFKFVPTPDTLAVGDTLIWTNRDILPHNVSAGAHLDSGSIAAGKSWRHVIRQRGTVQYHCRFHPTMVGTLVVR